MSLISKIFLYVFQLIIILMVVYLLFKFQQNNLAFKEFSNSSRTTNSSKNLQRKKREGSASPSIKIQSHRQFLRFQTEIRFLTNVWLNRRKRAIPFFLQASISMDWINDLTRCKRKMGKGSRSTSRIRAPTR